MFAMHCPGVASAPSGGDAESAFTDETGTTEPIDKLPRQEATSHNVA